MLSGSIAVFSVVILKFTNHHFRSLWWCCASSAVAPMKVEEVHAFLRQCGESTTAERQVYFRSFEDLYNKKYVVAVRMRGEN